MLQRERFLDILGSYMFVERRDEKVEDARGARTVTRETLIFPRFHQLDAVGRLVATAAADGPGRNYLIQHSAGSGKTNSISWLSHRLASLHDADDRKIYNCVVVITDRRVLDQQLQDAVYQIEHAQGVVKAIDQGFKATGERPGGRDDDRYHHAAEVPLRYAGPLVNRGCRRAGGGKRRRA